MKNGFVFVILFMAALGIYVSYEPATEWGGGVEQLRVSSYDSTHFISVTRNVLALDWEGDGPGSTNAVVIAADDVLPPVDTVIRGASDPAYELRFAETPRDQLNLCIQNITRVDRPNDSWGMDWAWTNILIETSREPVVRKRGGVWEITFTNVVAVPPSPGIGAGSPQGSEVGK